MTKEIELKGTESFIESNFDKIEELLADSRGAKGRIQSGEQASAEIDRPELSEAPSTLPAREPAIPQLPHDVREKRPPLRKYIRYVGSPGRQKISIQVAEQKPNILSIASLKEKFGLPRAKIEGIIRDAEKLGKIKRTANGSLVWTED